jgi:hypothetical protein
MVEPLKLTIELVPRTSWMTNVRSKVTRAEWDKIRKKCYAAAKYMCEICGDIGTNQGVRHPVECHEIWHYDDDKRQQVLTGLIALCPHCHKVKHAGLASVNGEMDIVLKQLRSVNSMDDEEAKTYIKESFDTWRQRSEHEWEVDISYLEKYLL